MGKLTGSLTDKYSNRDSGKQVCVSVKMDVMCAHMIDVDLATQQTRFILDLICVKLLRRYQ